MKPTKSRGIIYYLLSLSRVLRSELILNTFGFQSVCKHRPSCSEYMIDKLQERGPVIGTWLGLKRVIGCR